MAKGNGSIHLQDFPQTQDLGREAIDEPDFFGGLHLDQIVAAAIANRQEYQLDPFFRHPLIDAAAVAYRHDVVRDLGRTGVWNAVAGSLRSTFQT